MEQGNGLVLPIHPDGPGAGFITGLDQFCDKLRLIQLGFNNDFLTRLDVDAHGGDQFGIFL